MRKYGSRKVDFPYLYSLINPKELVYFCCVGGYYDKK